jgi:hypothetical protein
MELAVIIILLIYRILFAKVHAIQDFILKILLVCVKYFLFKIECN